MQFKKVIIYFLTWRVLLFVFLFLAIQLLPLQFDFIGGGLSEYLKKPQLWAWANFDGEHFLQIAKGGYSDLTYFFFPGLPLFIRFMNFFGGTLIAFLKTGLVVSNVSLILALIGVYKLVSKDFKEKTARNTIFLILLFPTSFYLGSVYSESLFLAMVVWSFYLARSNKWIASGVLASLSAITRLVGVGMFPALICEAYLTRKDKDFNLKQTLLGLFIIPLGIIFYMYFLYSSTGDPLDFLHTVGIYGPQRSSTFILLPQVFYRYIFKILPSVSYNYFPALAFVMRVWLWMFTWQAMRSWVAVHRKHHRFTDVEGDPHSPLLIGLWKLRLSYSIFLLMGLVLPSLSGSFSSMPRYVIVLFPAFILLSLYLEKAGKFIRYLVYSLLFLSLGLATALFVRGYWVS